MAERKGVMLAKPIDHRKVKQWEYIIAQPKLNGFRMRAVRQDDDTWKLYSSQSLEIPCLPHINEELKQLNITSLKHIDGEAYTHGMPFQQISSIVSRKKNLHPDYLNIQYHVFDMIHPVAVQAQRTAFLSGQLNNLIPSLSFIRLVAGHTIQYPKYQDALEMYYNQGYEGIIVRDPNAPYIPKKTDVIFKFKPRHTDTYQIVGFHEEISIDGEPKGTLGALVCKSPSNPQAGKFRVGTGFTREERIILWKHRHTLPGKLVMVKYQELTERGVPHMPVIAEIK